MQGHAFTMGEDPRCWRRDVVTDKYKKIKHQRVVQLKKRANLQKQLVELERKIADKEHNQQT